MFRPVTLPLWLFVLIVVFAGIAFLSHFLFPSVRWYFRRRMEKVVAKLNTRLDRPIQPFKLMERNDMIVRLIHDPSVMQAVLAEAAQSGVPESVILGRARRYAREIVPSFSATLYFGVATRLARWLARLIYRVRIGQFDSAAIEAIDSNATVVFVMNHRSNMDYVLVTYLASGRTALSYAVGEWARIWPLSGLIRSMGAYFIRRKSNSPLYRRVLARYVQMATEEGVTQAIFPEGGLSLDGRVGAARLGILSYIVSGYSPGGRDVVFIPVALNYDRVLEDRVLIEAKRAGERKFRASVRTISAFLGRHLWRKVRGSFQRFGYAAVSFGTPLSLAEVLRTGTSNPPTEGLADILMDRIRRNVPVLPVPLAAIALGGDTEVEETVLLDRARRLVAQFEDRGAHLNLPSGSADTRLQTGLATLAVRKIVRREGGKVLVNPRDLDLIAFYAASVRQLLDAPAAEIPAASAQKPADSVTVET